MTMLALNQRTLCILPVSASLQGSIDNWMHTSQFISNKTTFCRPLWTDT